MAEDDDLLQKADALMRRHRVFVAGATAPSASVVEVEDVPVLTEVVDPNCAAPPTATGATADLRTALAYELENWLDAELPHHVARIFDGITDQLIIQLSLKARADLLPRLLSAVGAPSQAGSKDD